MEATAIRDALAAEVVQTPATGEALNAARNALRDKIETKLRSLMYWGLSDSWCSPLAYSKKTWSGVMEGAAPFANFQAHICKWSDIRAGASPARLKYHREGIRKVKDSGGALFRGQRQEYPDDRTLNKVANDYLYQLFRAEGSPLANMAALLDRLEADYGTHRVVVSLDFYYSRPLTQLGLHKDTTGNTLFVGLHYDNAENMMGPEYIHDFYPKRSPEERHHAPWSTDPGIGGQSYWPADLLEGLRLTRAALEEAHGDTRHVLKDTTMSRDGLITFIDELIFHVTPMTRRRTEEEKGADNALFRAVTINAQTFQVRDLVRQERPKLTRSASTKDLTNVRGTSASGRRSFLRFWVMIEPKAWHVGG